MTGRGKQVKTQTLLLEQEIFLYDRRILASSSSSKSSALFPREDSPKSYFPDDVPDSSSSENTVLGWQTLFRRRRAWAIAVSENCRIIAERVGRLNKQIDVIQRGVAIAVDNVKQHFGTLQPKYHESKRWADQICEDQVFLLSNWQHMNTLLGSINACTELGHCLHGVSFSAKQPDSKRDASHQTTLKEFLDQEELKQAASSAEVESQRFRDRINDLTYTFDDAASESNKIIETYQKSLQYSHSDAGDLADRLLEEIDILARKIDADYEHLLGVSETQKSLSQAFKTAQLHKNNFMPSLKQTVDEINQLSTDVHERKERTMHSSIQRLHKISIVESKVATVHSKLANLDIDDGNDHAFDVLDSVVKLPSIYGSLLVECVKRQEWAEKMTADSSSVVEEIAAYKEEEARRRVKWVKEMGGTIDLASLDDMALGIEVNVRSQKHKWPKLCRDDIAEFVKSLRAVGNFDGALRDLEEVIKTLDVPTKQQSRRAKAFKNGSLHEAAFGRSLLLRGDDDVLVAMRNEKNKFEDKLKSAESRVRKLEDLLHRQSQVRMFSRPSSATGLPSGNGPLFERHASSPVANLSSALSKARETGSRRPSVSSRRVSMSNDTEERGLAQRLLTLETDLVNEKAKSADLAKKALARSDVEDLLKSQIREAISTKEDLLGNLEAQQREFDDERRLLHQENDKVKYQLDQLEDECDRLLDNREHEDRTRGLEEELERLKIDAASDAEAAQRQLEAVRHDYLEQQNYVHGINNDIRRYREEKTKLIETNEELELRLQQHDHSQRDHQRALRAAIHHLSQEANTPNELAALIETVERISEKSAAHVRDITEALEILRADSIALEARVNGQDEEIYDLRERVGKEERKVFSLHEDLSLQQAQSASLQTKLDSEYLVHNQLKTQLALEEKNSSTLQAQVIDREGTVDELSDKIAHLEVHHQDLARHSSEREDDLKSMHNQYDNILTTYNAQVSRASDISKHLLSQNAVLGRLLEQIGLSSSREGNRMIIQKAPRASSTSTVLNDPSMSMKRSSSGPMLKDWDHEPSIDSQILHWAELKEPTEMGKRFGEFMMEASAFDTNTFTEAIHKRVKEIEHIARKWQKEARAYRDKSHRAQTEAHDRIALRNFKEGDLALFLPTRDQATKPWAAFNVGAPHCFLREQDSHNLSKRDWLIARISKVEERVVDLSRSLNGGLKGSAGQTSAGDRSQSGTYPDDENPYELSDGLRWYLIDAAEEKPGAPINVGTGKVTVASANVDAKGSIRMKKATDGNGATKTLTRSLDSRRSSSNSKKCLVAVTSNSSAGPSNGFDGMVEQSIDNAAAAAAAASSNIQMTKDTSQAQREDRPRSSQAIDPSATSGDTIEHAKEFGASPSKSLRAIPPSPPKKPTEKSRSKAWDSLWSLDLNLESGKGKN